MAESKQDKLIISLDCAIGMLPMCTGGYEIFQFIKKCELSLSLVKVEYVPMFNTTFLLLSTFLN